MLNLHLQGILRLFSQICFANKGEKMAKTCKMVSIDLEKLKNFMEQNNYSKNKVCKTLKISMHTLLDCLQNGQIGFLNACKLARFVGIEVSDFVL